jgi:hypothetical protein
MRIILAYILRSCSVGKVVFGLLMWCAAGIATAGNQNALQVPQSTGLIWNRTGLPAVFPLQVKTPVGQDYFLKLIDNETGKDALAAYIVGGAFFKVLVPPGTYVLRFAVGQVWQGEDRLFGPDESTRTFDLPDALTFGVRDYGTKSGHIVNIDERPFGVTAQARVREQLICQTTRTQFRPKRIASWAKNDAVGLSVTAGLVF